MEVKVTRVKFVVTYYDLNYMLELKIEGKSDIIYTKFKSYNLYRGLSNTPDQPKIQFFNNYFVFTLDPSVAHT